MWRSLRAAAICLGLTSVGALSAWSSPTGLNTIPTPDLVPLGQYNVIIQNSNPSLDSGPTVFERPVLLPQFESGVTGSTEGGVDVVPGRTPGQYTLALNLKWKPVWELYDRPAVGVGMVQPVTGFSPTYYLVATHTLNFKQIFDQRFRAHHRNIKLRGRRVHAGILRTPAGTFPMLGTDIEISDQIIIYSDWISGSPNAVSLGGVYVLNDQNSVVASVLYGNHQQRFNGLLFNFTHTANW